MSSRNSPVSIRVTYFLKKSVIFGCFPLVIALVLEVAETVELGFRFFVAPLIVVFVLIGTFFIGGLEGALVVLAALVFAFCVFDILGLSGFSASCCWTVSYTHLTLPTNREV